MKLINSAISIILVFLCTLSTNSQAAVMLVNGSFENADRDPGSSYFGISVGDTTLTGWSVSEGSIHYIGTYWEASDGNRSIDLDEGSNQPGAIQQTFSTIAGQQYSVAFDMAGNPDGPPDIKQMRVSADSQSADFSFDSSSQSKTNMGWTTYLWNFTADDASATLSFKSLHLGSGANYGAALDNVSVNEVPLPAAAWLFLSALGGLGIIKRKRS